MLFPSSVRYEQRNGFTYLHCANGRVLQVPSGAASGDPGALESMGGELTTLDASGHHATSDQPSDLFTNPSVERALLGYLIEHPTALGTIAVRAEHFSEESHREVFHTLVELHGEAGIVDPLVLTDAVRRREVPHPASLVQGLVEEAGVDPVRLLVILDDCRKRRLLDSLSATLNRRMRQHEKVDGIIADILHQLTGFSASGPSEFSLIDDEEILKESADEYLIAQILPARSLSLFVGQTGSAKTFMAFDIALSVASGRPWHGHPVRQGPVVYIAAEGQRGLGSRVRAWKTRHGLLGQRVGVHFIRQAVDPLDDRQIASLHQQLRQLPEPPVLIIIDTWSKCLAAGSGDEDKAKDVNQALAGLSHFIQELGSTILLLHHEGHASKGRGRGSSALRAGVEMEAVLTKDGSTITFSNTKQRDATEFPDCAFRLCEQETDSGPPSCVLEPASVTQKKHVSKVWEPSEKAFKALVALSAFGPNGATYTEWRLKLGKAETTFRRFKEDLEKHGYVTKVGKCYRVTDKGTNYSRHRQVTANGGSGSDQTNSHQPPPPRRGGGGGGGGAGQEGCTDSTDEVEV